MHKGKHTLTDFSWMFALRHRSQNCGAMTEEAKGLGSNPASASFENFYYFLPPGKKDTYFSIIQKFQCAIEMSLIFC